MRLPKTFCYGGWLEKGSSIIGRIGVIMAILSALRTFFRQFGGINVIVGPAFIVNIIRVQASFILVIAVWMKNLNYLQRWLVVQLLLTLLSFGEQTFLLYLAIGCNDTMFISIMAPFMGIDILFQLCSLLIVYMFYRQLTSQRDNPEFIISEETS